MSTSNPSSAPRELSLWLWAATFASLVALAGTLYLSLGMGLKACPLCLYQRTFIMGVVGVLILGMFIRDMPAHAPGLLALPLAVGGLSVAVFHAYLESTGVLECPKGVLDFGTAPVQSLTIFTVLTLFLLLDQLRGPGMIAPAAACVLGGLFAFGAIRTAPPSALPTQPYVTPLDEDGCRRPFVPPENG